jgi:hypothetical protein
VLRIVCTEVLETHPSLAPEVTRLFLAIFRELHETDPSLPPSYTLAQIPEKMLEVISDDIFVVYSCIATIIPHIRELDRGAL